MKTLTAIVKRLLISKKLSFIITATVILLATSSKDSQYIISRGSYSYLLAMLSPFIFVLLDYKKLLYLGTSKKKTIYMQPH